MNDQLAYLITVTSPDGVKIKYFYDQKTGYKVRQYTAVANSNVTDYSDYRDVNTGIKIPFTQNATIVGQPVTFTVKTATVNSNLANDLFK